MPVPVASRLPLQWTSPLASLPWPLSVRKGSLLLQTEAIVYGRVGIEHGTQLADSIFLGIDCLPGRGDGGRFFNRLTPSGQRQAVGPEPLLLRKGLLGLAMEAVKWCAFLVAATLGIATGMVAGAAIMLFVAMPSIFSVSVLMGTPDSYNDVPSRCLQSNGHILHHFIALGGIVGLGAARSVCELVFQPLDGVAFSLRAATRLARYVATMALEGCGALTYASFGVCVGLCIAARSVGRPDDHGP